MIWLGLALANMRLSPLTTAVNILLMSLGTASIVLLLLVGVQLTQTMSRDAAGVDLVVGAQGSPIQLVLSAVYHADVPPGNIELKDAQRWAEDSRVAAAIPLSLGDSFRGYRIVGTTPAYVDHYDAELASGRIWDKPLEAVLGAAVAESTALGKGSTFAGAHGLVEGARNHDAERYRVVGVLAATGSVVDRLVITSLDSVWKLHGAVGDHGHDADHKDDDVEEDHREEDHREEDHEEEGHQEPLQITALLLRYRSPLAATTLPRDINAGGALQAASPAMEISRVLQLLGVGMTALGAFAWVLVATAALSVFAALYSSLRARRGELAMLRCLGASRADLLLYLIIEGFLMSVLGIALGFIAGHGVMELVGSWLASSRGVVMTGWMWAPTETLLLLGLAIVGVMSAIIPAIQAYRTNVARTLAEG